MAYRLLQTTGKVSGREDLPIHFYHNAFHGLGYSKALSEKRIKINENYADCLEMIAKTIRDEGLQVIVAGSRGDGMAVSVGSDIDIIYAQPAVKCFETETLASSMNDAGDVATFQLDLGNAPEGYAKLRLITIKEMPNLTDPEKHSLFLDRLNGNLSEENSCQYLRNNYRLVMEYDGKGLRLDDLDRWWGADYILDERSGPSQPHQIPLPFGDMHLSVDHVMAFSCYYPSALAGFCKRERLHALPSEADIHAVKKSKVLVVPAGEPDEDYKLNWRISFTQAEQLLVHSFNDTQIKVYAALKMLAKHHLKPICSNITSYVVKNIVFWVFEKHPSQFAEDDFIGLILQALHVMKDRVSRESLENYMIPSRNMFKHKISETQKADLLQCIDSMIEEGPKVLLRCPLVNEMSSLINDAVGLQRRLTLRDLVEQILYSIFSLSPESCIKIEKKLRTLSYEKRAETIEFYIRNVMPIARESNPFDFFNLLMSMTDDEIVARFTEGICKGWIYTWTEYKSESESSNKLCLNLTPTDLQTLMDIVTQMKL